jgi:formate hydrogenlyase transcriptional activator
MKTTFDELAAPARVDSDWKQSGSVLSEEGGPKSVSGGLCSDGEEWNSWLRVQTLFLREAVTEEGNFEGIIGRSAAISTLGKQIKVVAPTASTVLISGETGTGKELIARAIHQLSPRHGRSYIKVNCAAIPAGLIESELFGHERGAFTGAVQRRTGRFEMAHEGTLFLDEIGDIPLELQPKLLRVLQEQEFERVGGIQTTKVNVRIVAATSRDLLRMVSAKEFRADLYYRLNVFPLCVPPLRERAEDIPLLVRHFVDLYARRMDKSVKEVPVETLDVLLRYPWPGNVRELQNVVERAVIRSPGKVLRVSLEELQHSSRITEAMPADKSGDRTTLKDMEREHIIHALAATNWVLGGPKGAGARLGLARTTLIAKMHRLGITRAQA